ncbi:MAG: hypothetical protein R6X10_13870 [Desulfobacterales bacterium]
MTSNDDKAPEFYENHKFDPVLSAIGTGENRQKEESKNSSAEEKEGGGQAAKKKAGFYLSIELLNRFTRKFHELKLAGFTIENKSAFIEAALSFALDDIDQGEGSRVLQKLQS